MSGITLKIIMVLVVVCVMLYIGLYIIENQRIQMCLFCMTSNWTATSNWDIIMDCSKDQFSAWDSDMTMREWCEKNIKLGEPIEVLR